MAALPRRMTTRGPKPRSGKQALATCGPECRQEVFQASLPLSRGAFIHPCTTNAWQATRCRVRLDPTTCLKCAGLCAGDRDLSVFAQGQSLALRLREPTAQRLYPARVESRAASWPKFLPVLPLRQVRSLGTWPGRRPDRFRRRSRQKSPHGGIAQLVRATAS